MKIRRATVVANFILSSALVFFALALAYTAYRSRAYAPGTLTAYLVVLLIGLLVCALALRLRDSYKENIALSLVSFIAGAYLIEGYLACCTTPPDLIALRASAASAANLPFDLRTKYQTLVDMRQSGTEVYPSVNATQMSDQPALAVDGQALLPLSGISGVLTLHCNESGAYTFYQADEHGFNNPPGLYAGSRIVVVGDSFAHGNCVPAGQDIAGQLRRRWPNTLNLGYSGNGPLFELATLTEYAAVLQPDIVLWFYYEGNDLEDLLVETQNPLLLNYLQAGFSQDLLNRQPAIDDALKQYVNNRADALGGNPRQGWRDTAWARLARLQHLRDRLQAILRLTRKPPPPPPVFAEILQQANDTTSGWGGSLYLVYLPSWKRYALPATTPDMFYRDEVLSTALALGIPVIDIHQDFLQHPDPLSLFPFRLEGHYTAEGYELVASAVDAYLRASRAAQP